jgi:hypothetical protein
VRALLTGLLGVFVLAAPTRGIAGGQATPAAPPLPAAEAGAGGGGFSFAPAYAWDTVPVFGGARDRPRSMLAVDLRLHRRVLSRDGLLLNYTAGLVPVELEGGTVVRDPVLGERKRTVYGAGVDPVGLFALFGRGPLRLFCSLRGGVRLFEQSVPNPRGIRFDFTADFALGLAQRVGSRAWITAGPEFHHLSNGGLGEFNPSLNYLAVHLGVLVTASDTRARPAR